METRDSQNAPEPAEAAKDDKATKRWFEEFTVELRLQDVPGDAIGDAVAAAREFLTDSGETPLGAFGDPRSYAESLDLPRDRISRSAWTAVMVPNCLGLLSFTVVAAAVSSADASVQVTVPGFLATLTALALLVAAPLYLGFLLRGPWWRAGLAGAAVFGLQIAVWLLAADVVLFTLPAVPTALIGGAVLLSTSLFAQFRKGAADDPITDPLSGRPRRSFGLTLIEVLGNWMLFLCAAGIAAWFLLR